MVASKRSGKQQQQTAAEKKTSSKQQWEREGAIARYKVRKAWPKEERTTDRMGATDSRPWPTTSGRHTNRTVTRPWDTETVGGGQQWSNGRGRNVKTNSTAEGDRVKRARNAIRHSTGGEDGEGSQGLQRRVWQGGRPHAQRRAAEEGVHNRNTTSRLRITAHNRRGRRVTDAVERSARGQRHDGANKQAHRAG